jgi:hypothetical protein
MKNKGDHVKDNSGHKQKKLLDVARREQGIKRVKSPLDF